MVNKKVLNDGDWQLCRRFGSNRRKKMGLNSRAALRNPIIGDIIRIKAAIGWEP